MYYWCETCIENKTRPFQFRSQTQLFSHLRTVHNIPVYPAVDYISQVWKSVRWSDGSIRRGCVLKCLVCRETFFPESVSQKELEEHRKSHLNYAIESQTFLRITDLLRHIDREFSVHIGYKRGISHPRVFLDGITES